MKKLILCIPLFVTAIAFSSCAGTQELYSWYKYEDAAYQYQKRGTDELQTNLLNQYAKMAKKQKGKRGVVPPGFNAEYGYLLVKTGHEEEGIQKLKEEINLYPESEVYIGRIIKQLEK